VVEINQPAGLTVDSPGGAFEQLGIPKDHFDDAKVLFQEFAKAEGHQVTQGTSFGNEAWIHPGSPEGQWQENVLQSVLSEGQTRGWWGTTEAINNVPATGASITNAEVLVVQPSFRGSLHNAIDTITQYYLPFVLGGATGAAFTRANSRQGAPNAVTAETTATDAAETAQPAEGADAEGAPSSGGGDGAETEEERRRREQEQAAQ
jgi:hypothetical protein